MIVQNENNLLTGLISLTIDTVCLPLTLQYNSVWYNNKYRLKLD